MMSQRICRTVLILLCTLVIVACAPTPIGHWQAEEFHPQDPAISGVGMVDLTIREDGTFTAIYLSQDKSVKRGASGEWDKESDRVVRLFTRAGEGPEMTHATIDEDNKTLTVIGKGFTEQFKRK